MNRRRMNRNVLVAAASGLCLLGTVPALADAWGASWGWVEAWVSTDAPLTEVHYNADPNLWRISAHGWGLHSHVAPDADDHWELLGETFPWPGPDGHGHPPEILDGQVWARDVISTDYAGFGRN